MFTEKFVYTVQHYRSLFIIVSGNVQFHAQMRQ